MLIFLQSGIWREANSLVDPSLRRLVPNLLHLQLDSKAPSTVQKYRFGWLKWRQWAASKIGVQVIPAKPLHVALFISELTVISVSNNTGISSIESVLYGIKWGHSLAGIVDCPTSHPLVKPSLEGARRKLAGPVQTKEPLSVDIVCRIADHYISSSSLTVIRFLFSWLASLGFSVWTKFVICLLRMSLFAVNTCQFSFRNVRMISIGRGIHPSWQGLIRLLAQFLLPRGYLSFFLYLVSHLPPSLDELLNSKSKEYFHVCKGVSYTILGEEFRKYIKPFVDDIARYGTHSIKSGAALNPACRNVSADMLDMHAGWKCANSQNRYIKHTVSDRLKVPDLLLFSFGFLFFTISYLISSLGGGLKSCLARPRFPIRFSHRVF